MGIIDKIKHNSSILVLIFTTWAFKLLLIPAYYSTDFAVHQNWLRITHQYPLSEWYYNAESKWTLDYPPLFAYFEYILSIIANLFSPSIVQTINQLPQTIIFQRLSVIFTDLFYLYSLFYTMNTHGTITARLAILYLWIPFIILDNIHFQYNLIMQAILILSIGFVNHKKYLKAAFTFSVLLNFKHIYIYCSPAYFIYLIKQYIFNSKVETKRSSQIQHSISSKPETIYKEKQNWIIKFVKVAAVTLIPFVVSFGPFFIIGGMEQLQQIFSRLFPFSRGLVHEYWAPNFWALYYFLDKFLALIGLKGRAIYQLTEATNHQAAALNSLKVLPDISASITICIIFITLIPIVILFFITKKKVNFTQLVCLTGLLFFLFGFHVHEKAIAPYINLLFIFNPWTFCLNAAVLVNIVNLLPLLIQPAQKVLSVVFCLIWFALWQFLDQHKREDMIQVQQRLIKNFTFDNVKRLMTFGIQYLVQISGIMIVLFHIIIHPLLNKPNLQFLPLMLNSVWAACFNISWIAYVYYRFIRQYWFTKEITQQQNYFNKEIIRHSHLNYMKKTHN